MGDLEDTGEVKSEERVASCVLRVKARKLSTRNSQLATRDFSPHNSFAISGRSRKLAFTGPVKSFDPDGTPRRSKSISLLSSAPISNTSPSI